VRLVNQQNSKGHTEKDGGDGYGDGSTNGHDASALGG
jgi:hypothetical protein